MSKTIRIGTRGSQLAIYQAKQVESKLRFKFPDIDFELLIVKTKGDKILDVALSQLGDKGIFSKELENALLANEIDMAVHSLKDLPTVQENNTKIVAVLERGDARDVLVSKDNRQLHELTKDDIVATSSLRRKAQLLKLNPDLKIIDIRGNVNTRIRKLKEGYCTAMVMAAAGLQRIGLDHEISQLIDLDTIIPACGQAAIAIEIRKDDSEIEKLVSAINHEETMITTFAERTFLRTLEGGCQVPVGSYSKIDGDQYFITGFVSSLDGSKMIKKFASGSVDLANNIAKQLALDIASEGGLGILHEIKNRPVEKLAENGFLVGKTIISTRVYDEQDELNNKLKKLGAEVISFPMIEIVPNSLQEKEKSNLKNLVQYDWIIFTSKNGVSHFFRNILEINGHMSLPVECKIACIGKATASELEYYGYSPDFMNEKVTSSEFGDELMHKVQAEKLKILIPTGVIANNNLPTKLAINNQVDRINVYSTKQPQNISSEVLSRISKNEYDAIVCTSLSTVDNLIGLTENNTELRIVSIGSTTSKAIEKYNLKPVAIAEEASTNGLLEAILQYFKVEVKE